jgi:hypothetical protein
MKRGIFLSLVFLLAIMVNLGCDKLDIVKDTQFDLTFQVQSDSPGFNVQQLLEADSLSDDIDKYSNLIKDIELLEVSYQITLVGDANQADKINAATLSVADASGAGEKSIATVTNQDIAVLPDPVPMTLDQEGVARFEDLIKNDPHNGIIKVTGSSEGAPLDFTVKFVFKVKMTANPL